MDETENTYHPAPEGDAIEHRPALDQANESVLALWRSDRERGLEETSKPLQAEFLRALEMSVRQQIEHADPVIPREARQLEKVVGVNGEELGLHELVRDHRGEEYGQDAWLVIDFDDVLSHTTELQADIKTRVTQEFGLPAEEVETLWDQAYLPGPAGKKILRYDQFINQLMERFPSDRVEAVLAVNHQQYINQKLERALLAIKSAGDSPSAVRVSILTYGDPAYQRSRILGTSLESVVDDIIYSEGSKRKVLEHIRTAEHDQPVEVKPGYSHQFEPFIVTVDDNPDSLEDFDQLDRKSKYVNVRYHRPTAKRAGLPTTAQEVINLREEEGQSAVQLFKMVQIARDSANVVRATRGRQSDNPLFTALQDPNNVDTVLLGSDVAWKGWQGSPTYRRSLGVYRRTAQLYQTGSSEPRQVEQSIRVAPDGTIKDFQDLDRREIDWEEFIEGAEK